MKQRLPLVPSRYEQASRVRSNRTAAAPRARLWLSQPLICVAAAPDEPHALRFACSLIGALRTRGRPATGLLVAPAVDTVRGAVDMLTSAGAQSVALVSEAELPDAATRTFEALPPQSIVVGLSAVLAEQLQGLLTIVVAAGFGATVERAPSAGAADLYLGRDGEVVASLIADWLATQACINAHTETRSTQ